MPTYDPHLHNCGVTFTLSRRESEAAYHLDFTGLINYNLLPGDCYIAPISTLWPTVNLFKDNLKCSSQKKRKEIERLQATSKVKRVAGPLFLLKRS